MEIMGWKDTIKTVSKSDTPSWRDSIQDVAEEPNIAETAMLHGTKGISAGLVDEFAGIAEAEGRAIGYLVSEEDLMNGVQRLLKRRCKLLPMHTVRVAI